MSSVYSASQIRSLFPVLEQKVGKYPLIYFDNAATTQKPLPVLEAMQQFYLRDNANVHRGVHTLAERATTHLESARDAVKDWLGAEHREEIIFTKGATEAINLVAQTWGETYLQTGDEVLVTALEHHANFVPWQTLCEKKGAVLRLIPLDLDTHTLDLKAYYRLLNHRTKMVALSHCSNALGVMNPVEKMIEAAHQVGAYVLIDGAQAVPHLRVKVAQMKADFYVFSSHKLYGPMGVGVLYGKKALLEALPPYQYGGEMIAEVHAYGTTFNDLPYKFEAGTPNVAAVVGLHAALQWLKEIDYARIASYEKKLYNTLLDALRSMQAVRIWADVEEKVSICSFTVEGVHNYDVGQYLDSQGIAVRTGHHCAQPLMDALAVDGTIRVSLACYNTPEEIENFSNILQKTIVILKK